MNQRDWVSFPNTRCLLVLFSVLKTANPNGSSERHKTQKRKSIAKTGRQGEGRQKQKKENKLALISSIPRLGILPLFSSLQLFKMQPNSESSRGRHDKTNRQNPNDWRNQGRRKFDEDKEPAGNGFGSFRTKPRNPRPNNSVNNGNGTASNASNPNMGNNCSMRKHPKKWNQNGTGNISGSNTNNNNPQNTAEEFFRSCQAGSISENAFQNQLEIMFRRNTANQSQNVSKVFKPQPTFRHKTIQILVTPRNIRSH